MLSGAVTCSVPNASSSARSGSARISTTAGSEKPVSVAPRGLDRGSIRNLGPRFDEADGDAGERANRCGAHSNERGLCADQHQSIDALPMARENALPSDARFALVARHLTQIGV